MTRAVYACGTPRCPLGDVVRASAGRCQACGATLAAVGETVAVDPAGVRLIRFEVVSPSFAEAPTATAGTLRIDGRDVPVDLVLDVVIGLRDAGLLPRWSPDDGPVGGGVAWEPCDTVHPGPAGYERVAGIVRLAAERSRLLGLLAARGAAR